MAPPRLEVRDLTAGYGAGDVLRSLSLDLRAGEMLLLAGPNGVGKSTLLRALVGLHRPSRGEVRLLGERIDGLPPEARARSGMTWIPEGRGVIGELTVEDNLDLARFSGRWVPEARERSLESFPILGRTLRRPAGSLSGGEQQMLAIARALETGSEVVLIDEPSLGLAPQIVEQVVATLAASRDAGLSILVVEQRAVLVQEVADRAMLLRDGAAVAVDGDIEFAEMSFEDFAGGAPAPVPGLEGV